MKSNKKTKKKLNPQMVKKRIFSIIVILIILSFAASFFASASWTNSSSSAAASASPAPSTAEQTTTAAQASATPDPNLMSFLISIKNSMVVSEDSVTNASLIIGAVNAYNTLYSNDIVSLNSEEEIAAAIEKLKGADIYFDDISADAETQAWELVLVDETGLASLK